MGRRRRSTGCDVLQPLDPAGLHAGLAGVLLGPLVRLGLTRFAALLLLALGHRCFRSGGEMPRRGRGPDGGGVNVEFDLAQDTKGH